MKFRGMEEGTKTRRSISESTAKRRRTFGGVLVVKINIKFLDETAEKLKY